MQETCEHFVRENRYSRRVPLALPVLLIRDSKRRSLAEPVAHNPKFKL